MELVSENSFASMDFTEQVGFIIYFDPVAITSINFFAHEFKWGSPE